MQIGVVGRQPFQLGGSYQIVVGGDERQTSESGSKVLLIDD